jgi:hypothetical protein
MTGDRATGIHQGHALCPLLPKAGLMGSYMVLNFVTVSGNTTSNGNGAGVANLEGARALIAHTFISANSATGNVNIGSGVGGGVLP